MKNIILEDMEYEIIENTREGFDEEELRSKFTEYFHIYDYVVGDWAYGKMRLKGFFDSSNKQCKSINNINILKDYLKNNCAYNCKYFVVKKVYKNK